MIIFWKSIAGKNSPDLLWWTYSGQKFWAA